MLIPNAHNASITCVAFSPDGLLALSGSEDGTVRLWEVETRRELRCFAGHEGRVLAVAFFLSSTITSTTDPNHPRWPVSLRDHFAEHPSWTVVSAGQDRTIRRWHPERGSEVAQFCLATAEQLGVTLSVELLGITFSAEGRCAIFWGPDLKSGSHYARIWVGARGGQIADNSLGDPWEELGCYQGRQELEPQVLHAAYTTRGALALVAVKQNNGKYSLHELYVTEMSSDPSPFLSIHGPQVVHGLSPTGPQVAVAFSPNGTRLALSCQSADPRGTDRTSLRLFDMIASPREDFPLPFKGHTSPITCLTFSPEDCRILSGSEDRTVRLWCVKTGGQLRCFEGHTAPVTCVAISPDGRRALSGGRDCTLRLWELPAPIMN